MKLVFIQQKHWLIESDWNENSQKYESDHTTDYQSVRIKSTDFEKICRHEKVDYQKYFIGKKYLVNLDDHIQ